MKEKNSTGCSDNLVEMNHITKVFHGQRALDQVSLCIPGNCVYGLLGPNGAGKSTLLKCLRIASINKIVHGNTLFGCSCFYSVSFSFFDFRTAYDHRRICFFSRPAYKLRTTAVKKCKLAPRLLFSYVHHHNPLCRGRIEVLCHAGRAGSRENSSRHLCTSIIIQGAISTIYRT